MGGLGVGNGRITFFIYKYIYTFYHHEPYNSNFKHPPHPDNNHHHKNKMGISEQNAYIEEENDDPIFDILELSRSKLSNLSINNTRLPSSITLMFIYIYTHYCNCFC